MRLHHRFICLFLPVAFYLAMIGAGPVVAQESTKGDGDSHGRVHIDESSQIAFGITRTLKSKILNEDRTINIYLPPSYKKEPEKTYPVIYLLDGGIDEDYHHQTGLVQFMVMYQLMPESIVIGIANTDRKRDMTHPTSNAGEKTALPTSGGSENFLKFIERELQPFVKKNFRTGEERTLIGQSLGALLATEAFIKKPELFDNFVIVSPSLYWSRGELIDSLDEFLKTHPKLENKKVFLAIGKEHPLMHKKMNQFVDGLKNHAPAGIKWTFSELPAESHATVMHRATYRAYEFLYGDLFKGL